MGSIESPPMNEIISADDANKTSSQRKTGGKVSMVVLSAELRFHIPDAHSLKEKRKVRRSLIDGARHKFNASIAEVNTQEAHQLLTIGVAVVSGDGHHAREMLDAVIQYLEDSTDAMLSDVQRFE